MNPPNNERSGTGMQLPPPVEAAPEQAAQGGVPHPGPENLGVAVPAERAAAAQAHGAAAPAMPSVPLPMTQALPAAPIPQPAAAQASGPGPVQAADSDLIEKEWVNKAKQIVERTRNDPFKQSEQLTEIKVDYIKKRYGKTIKLK